MHKLASKMRRFVGAMAIVAATSIAFPTIADAQVKEFKGERVAKSSAKGRTARGARKDQVVAVGGRSSRDAYRRLASRQIYRPTFAAVRTTPVRMFPEDSFGFQLINYSSNAGNSSGFYGRYGQYMRSNSSRGTYYRNRTLGGSNRGGRSIQFHGVAP